MSKKGKVEGAAPVGRPTKYLKKYCDMLIEHMARGYSFKTFAAKIGVNRSTLYEWVENHKDFSDTKEFATIHCLLFWEKMGIEGTSGELKGFQANSWKYNMMCRFRDDWYEGSFSSSDEEIESVTIVLPKSGKKKEIKKVTKKK